MTQPQRFLPVINDQDLGDRSGVTEDVDQHEAAAHQVRNWVRLTYDCNNHCLFCLDSLAHDGRIREARDVKAQIVSGRQKGAERLILSGGEPTMHPNFLDFVKMGRLAGYPKIQTVTNGRMFAYPEFLQTAADNGLHEITFSLHGHTAELHDGLVATKGAFVEETAGLKAALASGRFIVNVDIVINKRNVRHLPEMLETFIGWGVREFDLLQIIPFGSAWGKARSHLFYDLEGHEEPIRRALEYSRRPDIHIWLNRFPPPYVEGFEELIQDPYKLNDEVRGRREEYDRYLSLGQKLSCRQPERCRHCYMEQLCDSLDVAIETRKQPAVDVLRVVETDKAQAALPGAPCVHLVAQNVSSARAIAIPPTASELSLELESYAGVAAELEPGPGGEPGMRLFGQRLVRCYVANATDLETLLHVTEGVDLVVTVNKDTEAALLAHREESRRLVLRQPNYDRVTAQKRSDVDIESVCSALPDARTENVPACLGGRLPIDRGLLLDTEMLAADGRVHMPAFAKRFISDGYYTKSRRCSACAQNATCRGVHINFVRAHGYARLKPLTQTIG